jgi:hypothetical protein
MAAFKLCKLPEVRGDTGLGVGAEVVVDIALKAASGLIIQQPLQSLLDGLATCKIDIEVQRLRDKLSVRQRSRL